MDQGGNNEPAPVVNAEPNQTITLPVNTVTLNGTATDDGLPNGTLIITWSVVSGPGTVTFFNPDEAVSGAMFSAAGVYVLKLTANDTQLQTSATTTVTVNPPVDQPPVVNAGSQPNHYVTGEYCHSEWVSYGWWFAADDCVDCRLRPRAGIVR